MVRVENDIGCAASTQTRVQLQEYSPNTSGTLLPSQVDGWAEDISPGGAAHFYVLYIDIGSSNSLVTMEARCRVTDGNVHVSLIGGPERVGFSYRVISLNDQKGVDFHCLLSRREVGDGVFWDIKWNRDRLSPQTLYVPESQR